MDNNIFLKGYLKKILDKIKFFGQDYMQSWKLILGQD